MKRENADERATGETMGKKKTTRKKENR